MEKINFVVYEFSVHSSVVGKNDIESFFQKLYNGEVFSMKQGNGTFIFKVKFEIKCKLIYKDIEDNNLENNFRDYISMEKKIDRELIQGGVVLKISKKSEHWEMFHEHFLNQINRTLLNKRI